VSRVVEGSGFVIEEYVPSAQFNASIGLEEKAKFTGFNVCIVYGCLPGTR
jgi:hypothetical protein